MNKHLRQPYGSQSQFVTKDKSVHFITKEKTLRLSEQRKKSNINDTKSAY